MNRINPEKLLLSKWTAVKPLQRRKHFIVTELVRDAEEVVVACLIEAVIDKYVVELDWQQLRDQEHWKMGWK